MTGVIPQSVRDSRVQPTKVSEGPPPSALEEFGANVRTTVDDITTVQDNRLYFGNNVITDGSDSRNGGYSSLIDKVSKATGKDRSDYRPWSKVALRSVNPFSHTLDSYDLDAVWRDIDRVRQSNPNAFEGIAKNRFEFEKQILTRFGEQDDDLRTVSRGGNIIASLAGGVVGSFADPLNLATLPIGGGAKTVSQAILTEAVINGTIEAVQQVPLIENRKRQGRELTGEEAATNIAAGFIFGGVIGGAGKYVGDNWGRIKSAPKDVQEKVWAKILNEKPELVDRIGSTVDWDKVDESVLPDVAEAIIGKDNLSEAQFDAINVLRNDNEIAAINPFIADGAGVKAHYDALSTAMRQIIDNAPRTVIENNIVPAASFSRVARLKSGTSLANASEVGARATLKNRIGFVESSGGKKYANPKSSARGLYQFINSTWLTYYNKRFGAQGLNEDQILAKRRDPNIQNLLMNDLIGDNERALHKAGQVSDAGNLYLAHFAGSPRAVRLLRADPDTPAVNILGKDVIEANNFLRGMSADDVVQWAHRKMAGGKGPRGRQEAGQQRGSAPQRDAVDPEIEITQRIDQEIADTEAQLSQLDADIESGATTRDIVGDALDNDAVPAELIDDIAVDRVDIPQPTERIAEQPTIEGPKLDGPSAEVQAITPELRKFVNDRNVSLNDFKALSKRLNANEGDVKSALSLLAAKNQIRVTSKGDFRRVPRDLRPVDIFTFIGRRGGLSPTGYRNNNLGDGGHDLATLFQTEYNRTYKSGKGALQKSETRKIRSVRYVPGQGPLVREGGNGLDEIGEALWEADYFGPSALVDRPTEREVLELLEQAHNSGERVIPVTEFDDPANRAVYNEMLEENINDIKGAARSASYDLGVDLDEAALDIISDMVVRGEYDGDIEDVVLTVINREFEAAMAADYYELDPKAFEDAEKAFLDSIKKDGTGDVRAFEGQEFIARNESELGADAQNGRWEEEGPISPDTYSAFDDPVSSQALEISDSIEHDIRAQYDAPQKADAPQKGDDSDDLLGGATRDEKRQALERRGDGGKVSEAPQKPVGSDGGLFDTQAKNQDEFRLNDEGDAVSPVDLLRELDDDLGFIKTVRDCL